MPFLFFELRIVKREGAGKNRIRLDVNYIISGKVRLGICSHVIGWDRDWQSNRPLGKGPRPQELWGRRLLAEPVISPTCFLTSQLLWMKESAT